MEHILIFIQELRNKVMRKGASLPDAFREYDKKDEGIITHENFRKLLANAHCFVDDEKFKFIVTPYSEGNIFYYDLFLHDLDGATTDKTNKTVSKDELRQFGAQFRDRGIDIIDCLREFDKNRTGRISVKLFLRETTNTALAQKIAKEFSNEATGEVEYFRLSREIQTALDECPNINHSQPQMKPDKNDLPPFFSDVAKFFKAQSIDPMQLLSRHDRFKRYRIQPQQFLSEMANLNLPITPNQLNILSDFFTQSGLFDYMAFCDEIVDVIRKMPKPQTARAPVVDLNEILDRFTTFLVQRRPNIQEQVATLDHKGLGLVPAGRFFRALNSSGFTMNNDECACIENEFSDANGNIDYLRFFGQVAPKAPPAPDIEDILVRLHNFLIDRNTQLRPRVEKFGTDVVQFEQLMSVLRVLGFDITNQEAHVLKMNFGNGRDNTINVQEFCRVVDPELKPPEEPEELPPLPRKERDEDASVALDAMTRVAVISAKYQLNLREDFRKYDTNLNGLISPDSFRLVINNLPIQILPKEIETLVRFYTSSGNLCSYDQFCSDMEDFGGRRAAQQPHLTQQILTESKPQTAAIDPILHKLKIFLTREKISPDTIFVPYDNTQSGMIPKLRVQSILESVGFPCLPSELNIICETFQDPRVTEKINYKKLCSAISQTNVTQDEIATASIDNTSGVIDGETLTIISNIREKLAERHKKPRQPFQGIKGPLMSQQDFRRCIGTYGLIIKEPDLQKIIRAFRRNTQGDIDFQSFLATIESTF